MGKSKKMVNVQSRKRFNGIVFRNRFTTICRTIKFKDEKSLERKNLW